MKIMKCNINYIIEKLNKLLKQLYSKKKNSEVFFFVEDYMKLILQGVKLYPIQIKNIQNLFVTVDGRKAFCNCLKQNTNTKVCLVEESFDNLFDMMFLCLLQMQDISSQFLEIRIITKTTFIYYM